MAGIKGKLAALYSLEQLSLGGTLLHRLHPAAKLLSTAVYVLCVASVDRYDLSRLAPFMLYPVLAITLSGIPATMILVRAAVALPFCAFAGVSSLVFDRTVAFTVGGVAVTGGVICLLTLAARAVLCVSAVLLLVALTPFAAITGELRRLHVSVLFVALVEMVYRYAGVLTQEAEAMMRAFRLRSNGAKLTLHTFGPFAGQLLLRSTDRACRVHQAMRCRLWGKGDRRAGGARWRASDVAFAAAVCLSSVAFRVFDIADLVGQAWSMR